MYAAYRMLRLSWAFLRCMVVVIDFVAIFKVPIHCAVPEVILDLAMMMLLILDVVLEDCTICIDLKAPLKKG